MEMSLLIKIGILVVFLVGLGIALTAYEFREHIMQHIKKRRKHRKTH